MRMSWKIGRVAGIDLFLHPTFLILLAFVGLSGGSGFHGVALTTAVFGCVLLHELGHLVDGHNSRSVDRERFADWFALEYGIKPTRDRRAEARKPRVPLEWLVASLVVDTIESGRESCAPVAA